MSDGLLYAQYIRDRERLQKLLDNRVFVSPVLAIGGTTSKAQHGRVWGLAGGVLTSKAATDDAITLAGGVLHNSTSDENVWLVTMDKDGTVTATEGTEGVGAIATLPAIPEDEMILGLIHVEAVSADFTPGTTALSAVGVTTTYINGPVLGLFESLKNGKAFVPFKV